MSAPALAPRQLLLPLPGLDRVAVPAVCETCDEARHLLGSDTLPGVARRLGYRTPDNLVAHLRRHDHAALADRYRALTP